MASSDEEGTKEKRKHIVIKNSTDLQRMKLEKLMKNPEKPVVIPERPKSKGVPAVPDFVRNVMGSSAGAGSGEFHVYRHLRRKEYARQKYMQVKGERERLDEEYHKKLEEHRLMAEAKTAKKRAKRLKKKQKCKGKNKKPKLKENSESESESSSEEESMEVDDNEQTSINESNNDQKDKEDSNSTEDKANEDDTEKLTNSIEESTEVCNSIDKERDQNLEKQESSESLEPAKTSDITPH